MRNLAVKINKVRLILALFSAVLTIALSAFIWIMLGAAHSAVQSAMTKLLFRSLILVVSVTIIAQSIYAIKGQVFEFDGRLAEREILFAIISFQVIMQFSFGFSLYAVNQTELQNASFDAAYSYFNLLQQSAGGNTTADYQKLNLKDGMPECVEAVLFAPVNDTSTADEYFRFPISDGKLLMKKSLVFFTKYLMDFAVSLLMSLVISVLLMAEMVYLAIKLIGSRINKNLPDEAVTSTAGQETKTCGATGYLRQIAFLFYFSGFLGSSFIPILARDLSGNNPNADFIAGLPYSVEAFANCIAIISATSFFRKKGWKPIYVMGIGVFITGLLCSALSPNVYLFIASRAIAGAGYGFCWMTLRNITTLSRNRAESFSSLSSGIYAGIMCGAAFGAVLADLIGYREVLLVSVFMAAAAAVFPIGLSNQTGGPGTAYSSQIKLTVKDLIVFAAFLGLIVIPTCVSEAFCGYVSPLYISRLRLPTAYVGRVSLVYNLCLVYISSTLLIKLVRNIKNPLYQCALHILLISLALLAAGFLGGLIAMVAASALLGSADGFGFSVQNAYILDTRVSAKLGHARMLTYISLFKKFGAMLGPVVFGLFIANEFTGLRIMGVLFVVCLVVGVAVITFFNGGKEAVGV